MSVLSTTDLQALDHTLCLEGMDSLVLASEHYVFYRSGVVLWAKCRVDWLSDETEGPLLCWYMLA
jgi:hypothetical protein